MTFHGMPKPFPNTGQSKYKIFKMMTANKIPLVLITF